MEPVIGFALCGSFCTFSRVLDVLERLKTQYPNIIRAFHVASRCTDCGECSRVCPQHIPLHLLNRKFIKDINELYGEYQAGADFDSRPPLMNFTKDDCEPSVVYERGGANG